MSVVILLSSCKIILGSWSCTIMKYDQIRDPTSETQSSSSSQCLLLSLQSSGQRKGRFQYINTQCFKKWIKHFWFEGVKIEEMVKMGFFAGLFGTMFEFYGGMFRLTFFLPFTLLQVLENPFTEKNGIYFTVCSIGDCESTVG